MADGTFAWADENVFRLKAAVRLAAYRIVLCGKYSSTPRRVRWRVPHAAAGNSPSPHRACYRHSHSQTLSWNFCASRTLSTPWFMMQKAKAWLFEAKA